ncbi:MAG: tryptophan 2,3-dioxygenase family protein [Planctomycetota bacterium]|jgi:tryptophan 2,3-dioxygenase
MAGDKKPCMYWDYIKIEELLSLQNGQQVDESGLSNDEVRFIVVHQIDELWMKLILRELEEARDLFRLDYVPESSLASASAALRRVAQIFELAGTHFKLMETMRTQDYLKFRDKLFPASGFQSGQMREIEILLGLTVDKRVPLGEEESFEAALYEADGSPSKSLERVSKRRAEGPSLKEVVYRWLYRTPIHGSSPSSPGDDGVVTGFVADFLERLETGQKKRMADSLEAQALTDADRDRLRERYEAELVSARKFLEAKEIEDPDKAHRIRRLRAAILFIDSNRELPLLSWPCEIVDDLVAAEQSMLIFRQRHARMVERVIGRRVGTGGSAGVEYLDKTALSLRVFEEIWATRTMLMNPDDAPPVQKSEYYGLSSG